MNQYGSTKEMIAAHSQWYISYLHTHKPMPVSEMHERLTEIRRNFSDRTDELRDMSDLDAVQEELSELQKSMIFFERLFPQVQQEVFRVLRDLETILAEGYRQYHVRMDLDSFQGDRVGYRLENSEGKRTEFLTKSKFRHYDSGFPSAWLDLPMNEIKKQMR